jgi:hypothetical protein
MATKIPGWQTGKMDTQGVIGKHKMLHERKNPGRKWPEMDTQNQGL